MREVREVRERERERERQRETETDGSDVIIVALKSLMSLHFPLPICEVVVEFEKQEKRSRKKLLGPGARKTGQISSQQLLWLVTKPKLARARMWIISYPQDLSSNF